MSISEIQSRCRCEAEYGLSQPRDVTEGRCAVKIGERRIRQLQATIAFSSACSCSRARALVMESY